jgi:hypothetical protein
MKILVRFGLSIGVVVLLGGCGGSQSPIGLMPQSRAIATSAERSGSWMLPEATSQDLLYTSDGGRNVYVFSYPAGAPVGKLTGFSGADGECVDGSGDVFITNAAGYILEYRHAGTEALRTINDYNAAPLACSVDSVTGRLAVANYPGLYSISGDVAVYKDLRGSPTLYVVPGITVYNACSYDNQGDLYVTGTNPSGASALAELPKGHKKFVNIALSQRFAGRSTVMWDGKHVAVGTPSGGTIYRLKITGSTGTVIGKSVLEGVVNNQSAFFWIQGDRVIVPFGSTKRVKASVGFWKYPAGGRYLKRAHLRISGDESFYGVTLSLARH